MAMTRRYLRLLRVWALALAATLLVHCANTATIQEGGSDGGHPHGVSPVSSETEAEDRTTGTSAKERFFALVKFRSEACEIDPTTIGTCTTSTDCTNRGGTNIGTCAKGFGTCCLLTLRCSAQTAFVTVRDKAVLLEQVVGANTCSYEFPRLDGSCQLMVEFLDFMLAAPVPATGACQTEAMRITGSVTVGTGLSICGMNAGQRIYLSYGRGERISMEFSTPSNGRYRIRTRHIPCNSPLLAPVNCLQYFTTNTGIVRSFSYGNGVVTGQYSVCIRDEGTTRNIEWLECTANDAGFNGALRSQFFLSNFFMPPTPAAGADPITWGMTGPACDSTSFVEVFGERKHCGARFTVEILAGGQIPVTSPAKPYQLNVNMLGNNYISPPPSTPGAAYTATFPYPLDTSAPEPRHCNTFGAATGGPAWAQCTAPVSPTFFCSCGLVVPIVQDPAVPLRTGFCLKYTLM